MKEEVLKRIMSKVQAFPGMPATASRLMPLLRDPDADASEIEEILRYDPGLTANILKLTNSAYFGIPTKISSVRQAVVLLGLKRLVQLVTTMCMSTLMKSPVPGYGLAKGVLWRHSVGVAVASDLLMRQIRMPEADEVFTAALLHDIGKLVLGEYVHEDMAEINDMVEKGLSFEVAEYIVLGVDHARIGAAILKNWSLPRVLVGAVRWHHDPQAGLEDPLMSDVVHTADVVASLAGFGCGPAEREPAPAEGVLRRLALEPEVLPELAAQTDRWASEIAEAFALAA